MSDPQRRPFLQSFSRRKGKGLTTHKKMLMKDFLPSISATLPASADQPALIDGWQSADERWLEIGFGAGEHMIGRAKANPQAIIVGCEVFQESFASALSYIHSHSIPNIRLWNDDARLLIPRLGKKLDRAFILFPDPWHKQRYFKRRIVNQHTLSLLSSAMHKGAELLLATDIEDYAEPMFKHVQQHPDFTVEQQAYDSHKNQAPKGWVQTRYQEKAIEEGRPSFYVIAHKS